MQRVGVWALIVLLLGCAGRPRVEEEQASWKELVGGAPSHEPALRARREYKDGASWPLRNFNGLDLFEPILPLVAAERGDGGGIALDTVVPLVLLGASFTLEGRDARTRVELGDAAWLGLDRAYNNYPLLWGTLALAAGSSFLPDPLADGASWSWGLRLDRLTVLGLGVGVSALEVELLRPVFGRTRPNGRGDGSRPSGHAATAFAAAAFMSDVLRESIRPWEEERLGPRLLDEAVCVLPYFLAAYISLERVHGEKHYLTDVLLGGAIGALTTHLFYAWSFLAWERDSPGWLEKLHLSIGPSRGGFELALRLDF